MTSAPSTSNIPGSVESQSSPPSRSPPVASTSRDPASESPLQHSLSPSQRRVPPQPSTSSPVSGRIYTPSTTLGKRGAQSSASPHSPHTPGSEPLHKKPRLLPQSRHTLERFSFAGPSIERQQPPSPLFFSHSPHLRPQLPPRFSSSEAGAKMLSKVKSEDNHVKTVTLARGTVAATPGPTSAPVFNLLDRSSLMRSVSPDYSTRSDGLQTPLGSIGVTELLEQDDRPTMIVDLGDSSHARAPYIRPVFVNASLRSSPALLASLCGTAQEPSPDDSPMSPFQQFRAWLLPSAGNPDSPQLVPQQFSLAGITWHASTLRRRFKVVSGTPRDYKFSTNSASSQSGASGVFANTSVTPVLPSQQVGAASIDEPQDYFGETAASYPPATKDAAASNSAVTSPSVVIPTTEAADTNAVMPSDVLGSQSSSMLAKGVISPSSLADPVAKLSPFDTIMSPRTSTGFDATIDSSPAIIEGPSYDWTRLPASDTMPEHVQFARGIDWANTALGPIETWSADLRQMCNLIMASPHPAAMYWGEELIAIYNEAYILLAGQKHPKLMGQSYKEAWAEIWSDVEGVFANAMDTGEATMKDDDRLFMMRNSFLEETYFSWSIIPLVGGDGRVKGLYNPAFEKTRRKLAERRMLTLREIGERTASARDVKAFWGQVLAALEMNEYDTPFVLLYSVSDEADSDTSSMHSNSVVSSSKQCILEGTLGVPEGHRAAPTSIDLGSGTAGFGPVFREVMKTVKPVLLEVGSRDLPPNLVAGLHSRGFGDPCQGVVVCPIHPTTGESVLGFLVVGVNPRRPYDEDYSLFVQLLSRQLATSLASVVLFEEEIRRGQRAARLAALDRMELSEQLAARTQEAIESETKFTRMAEFAPVGMFIANPEGKIIYCNKTWFDISRASGSRDNNTPDDHWMDAVKDEDRDLVNALWRDIIIEKEPRTGSFRFKEPWEDSHGVPGERWVLFSVYPEKYQNGALKSVFGSLTDISKQKWAEDFQKRKMEEAVELKKSLEKFVDMTSHEMRNPLSAILQCADDITNTMTRLQTHYEERGYDTPYSGNNGKESLKDAVLSVIDSSQTITLCSQHQKRIVDDVLTLSKLDSQLLLVTPVDAQPLRLVENALKMHEGELKTADIQLKFVIDPSYKALGVGWVRFDPSRVLQVLINLTTNAIKFTTMERKRTITVTIGASLSQPSKAEKRVVNYFPTRRKSSGPVDDKDWGTGEEIYIHFSVQDTGRGLDAEEKKMLFLRFSQASPRTHVQYGGSGLGLWISRELCELQGGEIGVESEAGVGSTFAFYVKARRTAPPTDNKYDGRTRVYASSTTRNPAADKQAIAEATPAKSPLKVLIVEDNLVNQRVMAKQLKNLGCIVYTANHGGEALDVLAKSTYWNHGTNPKVPVAERIELSVVLMDQEMPVMDGLTCTRKIRELERSGEMLKHVPIIAVTANARSEQIETALQAGLDAVQPKPFRIPELMERMTELCAKMGVD
ncbi:hypothetical protein AAFC00_000109 [Neodothiora populina]